MLLAIETSCDETAVALFEYSKEIKVLGSKISSQIDLHAPYGGVVPEVASRAHINTLPRLIKDLFSENNSKLSEITAVAATRGPGLKGCLLVGFSYGKSLALALEVPFISVNHLIGHLYAAELEMLPQSYNYPAIALIVSGGHTELILINEKDKYQLLARTRDDAAGEAFDKCATILDLGFPGGPQLSKSAALSTEHIYKLPIGVADDPTSFSFSGLKTAALRLIEGEKRVGDFGPAKIANICDAIEQAITDQLVQKSVEAIEKYNPRDFILTGGVAANAVLRTKLEKVTAERNINFRVPPRELCTDNAVMIGYAALRSMNSFSINELDPSRYEGATATWPLIDK